MQMRNLALPWGGEDSHVRLCFCNVAFECVSTLKITISRYYTTWRNVETWHHGTRYRAITNHNSALCTASPQQRKATRKHDTASLSRFSTRDSARFLQPKSRLSKCHLPFEGTYRIRFPTRAACARPRTPVRVAWQQLKQRPSRVSL